jgi:hypothetical protein
MLSGKSIPQAQTEPVSSAKKGLVILVHAFIGWALCAATMGTGMAVTTELKAMIIHAIGAPVFFTAISLVYFRRYNYTTPLVTAFVFLGFVVLVDFFLVALVIMKSLDMFTSPLGTWIPFALIFASTYLTGWLVLKSGSD